MTEILPEAELANVLAVLRELCGEQECQELMLEMAIGLEHIAQLNIQASMRAHNRGKPRYACPTRGALLRAASGMEGDPTRAAALLVCARTRLRSDDGTDYATFSALEYLLAAAGILLTAFAARPDEDADDTDDEAADAQASDLSVLARQRLVPSGHH